MRKQTFRVVANITVSVSTLVEATSKEEAESLAFERSVQGLCSYCATPNASEEWSLGGELDGAVEDAAQIVEVYLDDSARNRRRR